MPLVKAGGVGVRWKRGEWDGKCQRRSSPSAAAEAMSETSDLDLAKQ